MSRIVVASKLLSRKSRRALSRIPLRVCSPFPAGVSILNTFKICHFPLPLVKENLEHVQVLGEAGLAAVKTVLWGTPRRGLTVNCSFYTSYAGSSPILWSAKRPRRAQLGCAHAARRGHCRGCGGAL